VIKHVVDYSHNHVSLIQAMPHTGFGAVMRRDSYVDFGAI